MKRIHLRDIAVWSVFTAFCYATRFSPASNDFTKSSLNFIEIFACTFFGMGSMLFNIIPEFFHFGYAGRHFNDSSKSGKLASYLTKNMLRILFHVITGFSVFFLCFLYLTIPETLFHFISFPFFKWFILGVNLVFTITIWLLTRNHDGIFYFRNANFAASIIILWADVRMIDITDWRDAEPYVRVYFITISGFAWGRVFSTITWYLQYFFGHRFEFLRINWYSIGGCSSHSWIAWKLNLHRWLHVVFFLCACYFPHELWNARKNNHQRNCILLALIGIVLFPVETYRNAVQWGISFFYIFCTAKFFGPYYKRNPVAKIDEETQGREADVIPDSWSLERQDTRTQNLLMRHKSSYNNTSVFATLGEESEQFSSSEDLKFD